LDRSTEASDLATRALVKKVAYGIISDPKRYPDLREVDAARLCPLAAELALTPIEEELEALEIGVSAACARRRSLARAAWGTAPVTLLQRIGAFFGVWHGEVYLPRVHPPSF